MNVAEVLKKHGFSKIRFASDFFLSRPTLDEYIYKFENNEKLPKKKYQIIFDTLFLNDLEDSIFHDEYVSFKKLISRDRSIRIDELSPEATDKIFRIIDHLKESALNDEGLKLINYIAFISSKYNDSELVDSWVLYINELNSLQKHNEITERQKRYLGCFYMLNKLFAEDYSKLDISNYDLFIKRKEELKRNKENRRREIQEKVNEIIKNRIEEEMKKMSSDLSDDEIVKKIVGNI